MTNADRVREMSNKEMAKFLCGVKGDYEEWAPVYPDGDKYQDWMEWLREEADE